MSDKTAKKLPANIVSVLAGATREELAVALYLFSADKVSVSDGASALGITEDCFRSAVSFWRGAGVNFETAESAPLPPESRDQLYDADTVAGSLQNDDGFRSACDALQALYGKMFTRFDYDSLLYLYDHCGLTAEYMCTLASYCVDKGKTALKYFTKTAQGLVSDGIDTYEKLEKHLERRCNAQSRIYKLRKLCGFGERSFTSREEQYVNDWFAEKDLSFELVSYAYEITVNTIGEVKLSYMNKILDRWHKAGTLTPESVKQAEEEKKSAEPKRSGVSFDDDEFFAAAVARTRKKREERK